MPNRFIIITAKDTKTDANGQSIDNAKLFEQLTATFNDMTEYQIDEKKHLTLQLNSIHTTNSYSSFDAAKTVMDSHQLQFLVEYDDVTNKLIAMHDNYFSQNAAGQFYRATLDNLYLNLGKYVDAEIDRKRLMHSLTYGLLKELSRHNAGLTTTFSRGLSLIDYLYKTPPNTAYQITKKVVSGKEEALLFLRKNHGIDEKIQKNISDATNLRPALPQINLNEFDVDEMKYALENFGTFELVGPSIDHLKKAAEAALAECREVLNLPEVVLNKVPNSGFHGYQNVRQESIEKAKKAGSGDIRNQIAFHLKPYRPEDVRPEGVTLDAYTEYYYQGLALLHTLYRFIAVSLGVDPKHLINYLEDIKSVLTTRKYFPAKEGEIGISAHSDYGLLTLVVSDEAGLEVYKNGRWIAAPSTPGLRFYINFGDWFGFQLKKAACIPGVHRVPVVKQTRHSMALFLNPPNEQKIEVPNGETIPYDTYLRSAKTPYINKKL